MSAGRELIGGSVKPPMETLGGPADGNAPTEPQVAVRPHAAVVRPGDPPVWPDPYEREDKHGERNIDGRHVSLQRGVVIGALACAAVVGVPLGYALGLSGGTGQTAPHPPQTAQTGHAPTPRLATPTPRPTRAAPTATPRPQPTATPAVIHYETTEYPTFEVSHPSDPSESGKPLAAGRRVVAQCVVYDPNADPSTGQHFYLLEDGSWVPTAACFNSAEPDGTPIDQGLQYDPSVPTCSA